MQLAETISSVKQEMNHDDQTCCSTYPYQTLFDRNNHLENGKILICNCIGIFFASAASLLHFNTFFFNFYIVIHVG